MSGVFKVDWISTKELDFSDTLHLYNAFNEGKTVKIARDGQEVDSKTGSQLCSMFLEDKSINFQYILKKSRYHRPSISTAELRHRRQMLGLPDEGQASKEYLHVNRLRIPHKHSRMVSHPYYVRPPMTYPSYQYNLSGSPMVRYYKDVPMAPYQLPVHVSETYTRSFDDYNKRNRSIHFREHHYPSHRREKEHHTQRHHYH